MVRIEDRPNVMRVVKPSRPVKKNDWVRLTSKGDYENDVARVTDVRESEGMVTLQVCVMCRCLSFPLLGSNLIIIEFGCVLAVVAILCLMARWCSIVGHPAHRLLEIHGAR
jgi:hypothetical protein